MDNLSIYHFQVVSYGFRNPPLFTIAWQNVKSRSAVTQKVLLVNDVLRHSPHQLAILTSWYWVRRSPCMDFLPPSGGVFRLSLAGSSPGIPCRRSCCFQGATGKTATKKPSQNRPALPSLFLEGHASRLCNGWKPRCSAPQGLNEYVKICYIQLLG